MATSIGFVPYSVVNGNNGLFNVKSDGIKQGTAYPDPSTQWRRRQGIVASTETLPMWGGVGVFANIPGTATPTSPAAPSYALGTVTGRATALTGASKLVGFSVFDRAYNMVTNPQNNVPIIGGGGSMAYYELGSLARIGVACDPSLVSLRAGTIQPQVSWDFENQLLVPYLGTLTITSGTYNSTTGAIVLLMAATPAFDAGDSLVLASLTGTGAFASLDGEWPVTSISGDNVTLQGPVGEGAATITGGNATVGGSADAALPVTVLDIQASNCETVTWSGGVASWNFNGAAAIIQI
jgi:hypothetical protein